MTSFQIQKADRNGDFEDVHQACFECKEEAVQIADHWARRNPNCAWGVQVVNTSTNQIVWSN